MNPEESDDVQDQTPVEAPVETTGVQQPDLEQTPTTDQQPTTQDDPVLWSASEYIHVEKNGLWYILFFIVVLGLIALDIFILKSYTFSALVIVMAVALIIYSRRPPRTIQYALSDKHGLYIGEHLHSFSEFKAFGLIKDGEHHSIMLIPIKRFAPGTSVYFPEEAGEEIVDIMGSRLPMQPLKLDLIDKIVRQLRL